MSQLCYVRIREDILKGRGQQPQRKENRDIEGELFAIIGKWREIDVIV